MARRLGTDKEIEGVRREAEKQKWEVTITGGNHIKWKPPNGMDPVFSSLTGCGPGWVKAKSKLKRAGLHI